MASYIYMQNLNEISQIIFSILYVKIKNNLKLNIILLFMGVYGHLNIGHTLIIFIYLFGVLHRFQHYTGHITTGSWEGRGNQYIQFARVVYCKLLTNGKQLPAFPLKAVTGIEPRPQRWEARVLPLCHRGP